MTAAARPRPTRGRFLRPLPHAAASVAIVLGILLVGAGFLNNRYLDAINDDIAAHAAGPEERILLTFERVSQWQYFDAGRIGSPLQRWMARAEHASPLHVSARSALTAGVDHSGPCGAVSRSLVVLLRRAGFQARKAILYDAAGRPQHTVVEVLHDGEWRVFDPTYAWVWHRPSDGELATAEDLRRDPVLFATILERHPSYSTELYSYRNVYHMRWEKLPGLIAVRDVLRRIFGEQWVREVNTPYLYERPAFFTGSSLLGAGVLAVFLLVLRERRRAGIRGSSGAGTLGLPTPLAVRDAARAGRRAGAR